MTELLKKISTPTYLYVILIFIGYINYFSFYIFFDVNIIDYLTFGELLLSFLNLTIPILVLAFLIMFFVITARIRISTESIARQNQLYYSDNLEALKGSLKNIKSIFERKKWKSFWTYLNLIKFMFQFVVSVFIFLFLMLFPLQFFINVLGGRFIYNPDFLMMLVLSFIWCNKFSEVLERVYKNTEINRAILYSSFLFVFFGILCLHNRNRAMPILVGENLTQIEFVLEKQTVKTNSDTLYIGQTQNFLFLRDRKKEATLIYPKDKIEFIKIIKKQ